MKQIKKTLSTYKRKMHIDNEEWSYQIAHSYGTSGFVKVCSPDRYKKWSLKVGVLGHYKCDICGQYSCVEDNSLQYWNEMTPKHVKRLIEKRILGRKISR